MPLVASAKGTAEKEHQGLVVTGWCVRLARSVSRYSPLFTNGLEDLWSRCFVPSKTAARCQVECHTLQLGRGQGSHPGLYIGILRQIVFVATEVAPWSKVGGLGDVMAALPAALAARGHQVMTVAPRYATYPDAHDTGVDVPLQLPPLCGYEQPPGPFDPPLPHTARYFAVNQGGVNRVFVDHKVYAGLATDIYGSADTYMHGDERQDLDLRYSILCQAALAAPLLLWGSGAQGSGSPGYASQTTAPPVPMPGPPEEQRNGDEDLDMWARRAMGDFAGEGLALQHEEPWNEDGQREDGLSERAEEQGSEGVDLDLWPRTAGDDFVGEGLGSEPDGHEEEGPPGDEYSEPQEEQRKDDLDWLPRTSGADVPGEGLLRQGEAGRDEEGLDLFPRTAGGDDPTDNVSDEGLQWSGGDGSGLQIWGPGGDMVHQLRGWEQGAVLGFADGGTTVPELQAFACQSQASGPDAGEQGKLERIRTPAAMQDQSPLFGHAAQPISMHAGAPAMSDAKLSSSGVQPSSVRQPVSEVAMTPEPGAIEQPVHVRAHQTSTMPDRAGTSNRHHEAVSGDISLRTTAGQALKEGHGQDLNAVAPGGLGGHQRRVDAHLEEGRPGPGSTAQQSRPLRHAAGLLLDLFFHGESPQPDMEANSGSKEAVRNSNMMKQDEGVPLGSDLAGTNRALQTSTVPDRAGTSNGHHEAVSGESSLRTTAGQALKDGPGQDLTTVAPGGLEGHHRGVDAHLEEGTARPGRAAQQSGPLRHAAGLLLDLFFREESPQPDMEATSASKVAVRNSNIMKEGEGVPLGSDLAGTHGDGPQVTLRPPAQLESAEHAVAQLTHTPRSVSPVHPSAPQQLMSEVGLPPQVATDVQPRKGPLGALMRFTGFLREHLKIFVGIKHNPDGAPLRRRSGAQHSSLEVAGVASTSAAGAGSAPGEVAPLAGGRDQKWMADGGNAAPPAGERDQKWMADGADRSSWQGGAASGAAVFGASVTDADMGRSQGGDPVQTSGFPPGDNPLGLAAAPHPAFESGLLGPGSINPHLYTVEDGAGALGLRIANPMADPLQLSAEDCVFPRDMTTECLNIPWEGTLGDEQGPLLQRLVETQRGSPSPTGLPFLPNATHHESGDVHACSPLATSLVADDLPTLRPAGSVDGPSASPHNTSEPTIIQGHEEAPDDYYSGDFAPGNYYSDDREMPADDSQCPAEEDVPAPVRWETEVGAAALGPLTFVCNDWPCAPLVLRLRNLRAGTPQMKGCPASWSWPSGVNGKQSERAVRFRDQLASSLEEARAIFCIHNLAYQGRFARENFWNLCLPPQALLAMAWPPPPIQSIVVGGGIDEAATDITYGVSSDLYGVPFDRVVEDILEQGWRRDREVEQRVVALLGDPLVQPDLNWMQAAVSDSDMVVTVSPRYADEICKDEAMGCGLRSMLETRGVRGIMNGIDTVEWDPESDLLLPEEMWYNAASAVVGKALAKQAFQERFQLQLKPNVPLFACIGRLTDQKGIDVLLAATPDLLAPAPVTYEGNQNSGSISPDMQLAVLASAQAPGDMQLAILGTGTTWMEAALSGLSDSYPGKAAGIAYFSESLAHLLLAAADYVVVPSRFEPCGLVAQCGVRYGAVPVVASVGGLSDLVTPEVGIQMGVVGPPGSTETRPEAVEALTRTMKQAAAQYGTALYREWQQNCMALNVSWDKPAIEWEEAVLDVLAARPANMPRPTKRQ